MIATSASAQTQAPAAPPAAEGSARFAVMLRGVRIGSEQVDVSRFGGGFRISSSGQIAPPVDLVTQKFEVTYSGDWQPQQLSIEGTVGGQPISVTTSFGVTTATTEVRQGTQRGSATHDVSPRAVVLPSNVFGAYEVLAARLASAQVGSRIPVYVAPEGEASATVDRVTQRRISSPSGQTDFRQFDVTLSQPRGRSMVQVWVDERGRLARLAVPATGLTVIRDDIASVMAREENVRNPGDENVFIPSSGFNLAATITKPASPGERMPVVILIGSLGRQDRDEMLYGVPIFGQLAGSLAQSGILAVRFDKRGVGQSGGRPEHASLVEYAEDVVAIVNWLRRRKDIDQDRIAVAGHGEGAAIALTAAAREKRIRHVVLLAAPGAKGSEVTLEQQQRTLARLNETQADRQAKVELQRRVIDAVITGNGWDTIPPDVRRQAEGPWFKSWLLFDPAAAMKRVDARVLIVHGALDQQMPVVYADRLEAASAARRENRPELTSKVILPDVNHLLTPAKTGDPDEYEHLPKTISPAVAEAIVRWMTNAAAGTGTSLQ